MIELVIEGGGGGVWELSCFYPLGAFMNVVLKILNGVQISIKSTSKGSNELKMVIMCFCALFTVSETRSLF